MQIYMLTPNDVLFFRDGRPMEAAGGHGARWPEPSLTLGEANLSAKSISPKRSSIGVWTGKPVRESFRRRPILLWRHVY